MTIQRFFDNPHFRAYVRLLFQLHRMIRVGTDETAEGEELRDQMDGPADHLDQDEIDCVKGISADFYTLSDPPWQVQQPILPTVREDMKEVLEARDAGAFVKALELLRKNQVYHDTATVTYMRGRIWSEAREREIAVQFFQRAKELAPENGNYAASWLNALRESQADEALRVAQSIIQQPTDHPPQFILQAADVVLESTRLLPDEEE